MAGRRGAALVGGCVSRRTVADSGYTTGAAVAMGADSQGRVKITPPALS